MKIAAAVLASAVLSAGCEVNLNTEGVSARETTTYKLTGQPELALDTFDGAIELHSWDRSEIEIEVDRRAMEQAQLDQIKVEAKQDGNSIRLRVTGPPRERHGLTIGMRISPTARLRVVVPRHANIVANSGDGSIRAEAIEGTLVLTTADGSVNGARLGGDVRIRSGDGSIRLQDTGGKLDLETKDGSIGIEVKPTVLHAKTGDGTIRARIAPDTSMADNWDLTTGDGSVVVALPGAFSAELDAETSDGSVRADHPLLRDRDDRRDESSESRHERRRALRSRIGDGGKVFRIRTGDGTIRIER